MLSFEDCDLLTKCEDIEREIGAGTYEDAEGRQECEDEIYHEIQNLLLPWRAFQGINPNLLASGSSALHPQDLDRIKCIPPVNDCERHCFTV